MRILGNKKLVKLFSTLVVLTLVFSITACSKQTASKPVENEKPTIIFADLQWDSIQFHNKIAEIIVQHGYGYKTDETIATSPVGFAGLIKGDIDVIMETWSTNYGAKYTDAIKNGDIIELSLNFDDNAQGLYVPTYMIKGDKERGIEPMAPDLKNVRDLSKYWELFKDPEDPSKGRIYGAIPGWEADRILSAKLTSYGLDKTYNYFSPGSDTALQGSMTKAYEKGEPWVGYYWEPTWIMGKYDMTLLGDVPFDKAKWEDGFQCEIPAVPCTVVVHKDMEKAAPDLVEFFKNYKTSSAVTSEALAYMQDSGDDAEGAAKWFLKNHEEIWTKWVSTDVVTKVKEAIK